MWICVHFHPLLLWIYIYFFYLQSNVTKPLENRGCRVCACFFFLTKFRNLSVSSSISVCCFHLLLLSHPLFLSSDWHETWVVPYVVVCWLDPFSLLFFALALYLKCFSTSLRVKTFCYIFGNFQCFRQAVFICKSQMPANECLMKTQLITVWLFILMMMMVIIKIIILLLPLKSCPWTAHCLSSLGSSNRSHVSLNGLRRAYIFRYFSNVDKTQLRNGGASTEWRYVTKKGVYSSCVIAVTFILGSMGGGCAQFWQVYFLGNCHGLWKLLPLVYTWRSWFRGVSPLFQI